MSPGREGPSRRSLIALAILAPLALLLVGRLACRAGSPTAPAMVLCAECGFCGNADLPVGEADWPAVCPKCGKRSAFPPLACPNRECGKLIPADPKNPPTKCPFCGRALGKEDVEGP